MVSAPSAPQNVRTTGATATSITVAWSPPANNGGAAIQSYALTLSAYNPSTYQFDNTVSSPTVSGITGTAYTISGLVTNEIYSVAVQAYNGSYYSDTTPNGAAGGHTQTPAVAKNAATLNYSCNEVVAVSESGTPLVTPPSAFGVALRADQAIDFVFAQLTSQTGRTDPDTPNVDPYLVMTSNQPITRLALGTADVVPGVTDSEQLAGEIPTGTLASAKGVVAHTTGASSFTVSKTWSSDRSAQIYTMALLNNLPIAYVTGGQLFQPSGSIRRALIWTYDIPTPIGVGPGDSFTTTVTIAF